MTTTESEEKYPRVASLGLTIHTDPAPSYVLRADLMAALGDRWDEFCNKYGDGRTSGINGPFPWDVEDVLRRMRIGPKLSRKAQRAVNFGIFCKRIIPPIPVGDAQ